MRHRTPRHPALRRALVPLLVAGLVLVGQAPVWAHDTLVGSEPADGATAQEPPVEVVLTFSADQLGVGAAVTVTGPDGAAWAEGAPTVDGERVVQALRAGMPAGAYAVEWRSVSGDGHPVTGSFVFEVAGAASAPTTEDDSASAPSASVAPTEEPQATTSGSEASPGRPEAQDASTGAGPTRGVAIGAALGAVAVAGLVGAVALVLVRRRAGRG